ncbi:hypothetical protein SFOMI_5300 [Sphingobium fuliginis]|uniref:Uncharacterized protein n=1 Tax=Sphingobium fuliginis (strain ATCC 27551) TaxID=336203 RepID=A0A292ZPC8_SPHSA|nr:hypothetical protein SFOMI_5300 [Sphingobium fuliginis]
MVICVRARAGIHSQHARLLDYARSPYSGQRSSCQSREA